MTSGYATTRGAVRQPDGSVRFSVWAPLAGTVSVRLFEGGRERSAALEPLGGGVYEGVAAEVPAGADYVYRLDDARDAADPVSRFQPEGVHGPSRVVVPDDFAWSDEEWRGIELADACFYEVHVGTATRKGTFDALVGMLPRLGELGVNAIELMPVAQFPGERNWGYDGVFPYAPQNSYGGPEGLRRFVNEAHAAGFAVYLDVVYNHLGPEGNVLAQYGPYFTDRYRTPWGAAINFDGPDSDEVRRYFVENAVYWVSEFHIDGLRLDAVHAICDFSAVDILEEIAAAVHRVALATGRRIHVIAESDLNDPRLVRSRDRGGYNLDGQWNDDFHHAVHAAVTGERSGYYVDFDGLSAVEKALTDRYVLDGVYSRFRRRRHGAPARDLSADRFIGFIQNHDQVGNRAVGERLGALVSFERQKAAAAMLLLSPYVPLLFMGEEYGETNPFLYFVSHTDSDLVEAVRRGRREEFRAFGWGEDVPDPQAVATFERSRIEPSRAESGHHAHLLRLYRDLIAVRKGGRSRPAAMALRPGVAEDVVTRCDAAAGWLTWVLLHGNGRHVLAGVNLAPQAVEAEVPLPEGRWMLLLSTDDIIYGGAGGTVPEILDFTRAAEVRVGLASGGRVPIPASSAVLFEAE